MNGGKILIKSFILSQHHLGRNKMFAFINKTQRLGFFRQKEKLDRKKYAQNEK